MEPYSPTITPEDFRNLLGENKKRRKYRLYIIINVLIVLSIGLTVLFFFLAKAKLANTKTTTTVTSTPQVNSFIFNRVIYSLPYKGFDIYDKDGKKVEESTFLDLSNPDLTFRGTEGNEFRLQETLAINLESSIPNYKNLTSQEKLSKFVALSLPDQNVKKQSEKTIKIGDIEFFKQIYSKSDEKPLYTYSIILDSSLTAAPSRNLILYNTLMNEKDFENDILSKLQINFVAQSATNLVSQEPLLYFGLSFSAPSIWKMNEIEDGEPEAKCNDPIDMYFPRLDLKDPASCDKTIKLKTFILNQKAATTTAGAYLRFDVKAISDTITTIDNCGKNEDNCKVVNFKVGNIEYKSAIRSKGLSGVGLTQYDGSILVLTGDSSKWKTVLVSLRYYNDNDLADINSILKSFLYI